MQIFLDNLDNEIQADRRRDFKRIDISPAVYEKFDLEDCFKNLDDIEGRTRGSEGQIMKETGKIGRSHSALNLEKKGRYREREKSRYDSPKEKHRVLRKPSRSVSQKEIPTKKLITSHSAINLKKSRNPSPNFGVKSRVESPMEKRNRMKAYDVKRKRDISSKNYLKIQTEKFKKFEEKKIEKVRSSKSKRLERDLEVMRKSRINSRRGINRRKNKEEEDTLGDLISSKDLKELLDKRNEREKVSLGSPKSLNISKSERRRVKMRNEERQKRKKGDKGIVGTVGRLFRDDILSDEVRVKGLRDLEEGREGMPRRRNNEIQSKNPLI